jgi:5-formyltetrahydrofolate cyclo-ligase
MSVENIRQEMRSRRRSLSKSDQLSAAQALDRLIAEEAVFKSSRNIAVYLAADGEINCEYLIKRIWQQGKQCYLPVLHDKAKSMSFRHYTPRSVLAPNQYKLLEPEEGEQIAPENLDLVITPLVAFDNAGNRIGMGGGYYDRTFAFKNVDASSPFLMGVAHGFQLVNAIEAQPWDIVLDKVLWV